MTKRLQLLLPCEAEFSVILLMLYLTTQKCSHKSVQERSFCADT